MSEVKSNKKTKDTSSGIQLRVILFVVVSIFFIFVVVSALFVKIIGDYSITMIQNNNRLLAEKTGKEINTWFANEAQIVANQKATIEIEGIYDRDHLTEYLTRIVDDYDENDYIYDLYFVDTNNVMSSGYGYVPDPSIDFRTRDWYTDAVNAGGQLFYSNPYKDSNLDRYVVTISSTVNYPDGSLAGVLALDIFVDTLFEIVENGEVEDGGYAFLVDNSYGLATHPYSEYSYVNELPQKINELPGNPYADLYEAFQTGDYSNVHVTKDFDGEYRGMYVSEIPDCGWYVVVTVTYNQLYGNLLNVFKYIFVILIVVIVAGILIARFATMGMINRLNDAAKVANEASETKSSFLASMSHEIRTPINAVIGMNEMILRENKDPQINEYALDIASASRSLTALINDILDFSKIESGKIEIIPNEFNIASIINDIVSMSMSRLGEKKLQIIVKADPNIPAGIVGDEQRIKQIIVNLMTNGIKYTNEGFVTLKLSYTKQEYGINLDISVKDSGIGISEENLDKLFNSFERVDTKKNRFVEGTGLGLAICKQLVTNMGGFINVTSEYGVGSEFKVSIPLEVVDEQPFVTIKNADQIHALLLLNFVDIDVASIEEYKSMIRDLTKGFNLDVRNCMNFEELQDKVKSGKYNYVFIDRECISGHEEYFKSIADSINVTVIQDRMNAFKLPNNMRNVYKPFYLLSAASIFNKDKLSSVNSEDNNLPGSFVAPGVKILIVDDNVFNLKVAVGLMKPYRMEIKTAKGGKEAIEMINETKDYDLIFMDHMMPEMDGVEAVQIIRSSEDDYCKKVPIVALTANMVIEAREMFIKSGFDDFLAKPIDVSMLDRILRKYIPRSKRKNNEVETLKNTAPKAVETAEVSAPATDIKGEDVKPVTVDSKEIFDEEVGLMYTANDEEFYLEILDEYITNSDEMKADILKFYEAKDWDNYIIKVHALKSSSLSIGAKKLSEMAKEMEFAGKEGNVDLIHEKTQNVLDMYEHVLGILREYVKSKS